MIAGIIPARYASSRFPGKPLADIAGKTMIRRVYEQARQCTLLDRVIIATDDERIFEVAKAFHGEVLMTSSQHQNGTERCAEVAAQLNADHYINIQGDEPFIQPDQIGLVCQLLKEGASIATLKKRISTTQQLFDPNVVKVVTDVSGKALYFSRNPIPFLKDQPREAWLTQHTFYKHLGLYGFDRAALLKVVSLPHAPLETAESLEQLRWISHGFTMQVSETEIESIGIDVPEDIARALRIFQP